MAKYVSKKYADVPELAQLLPRKSRSLLASPISALTPEIKTVGFDHHFAKLNEELNAKQIHRIKIETYFGDEWFCPDQSTAIAIPFWLADERLKQIERSIIGYVEGETADEFMRLLRHEAGHCMDHAYRLSRRRDWRRMFGNPNIEYDPDRVKTTPGHPDYVVNLRGWYAQTHPEEDFAETFAIWLDPNSNWEKIYRKSPIALKKLNFVDALMTEVASKTPQKLRRRRICNARRMRRSLESYYQERLRSDA